MSARDVAITRKGFAWGIRVPFDEAIAGALAPEPPHPHASAARTTETNASSGRIGGSLSAKLRCGKGTPHEKRVCGWLSYRSAGQGSFTAFASAFSGSSSSAESRCFFASAVLFSTTSD